jgi:hypothetical protein
MRMPPTAPASNTFATSFSEALNRPPMLLSAPMAVTKNTRTIDVVPTRHHRVMDVTYACLHVPTARATPNTERQSPITSGTSPERTSGSVIARGMVWAMMALVKKPTTATTSPP